MFVKYPPPERSLVSSGSFLSDDLFRFWTRRPSDLGHWLRCQIPVQFALVNSPVRTAPVSEIPGNNLPAVEQFVDLRTGDPEVSSGFARSHHFSEPLLTLIFRVVFQVIPLAVDRHLMIFKRSVSGLDRVFVHLSYSEYSSRHFSRPPNLIAEYQPHAMKHGVFCVEAISSQSALLIIRIIRFGFSSRTLSEPYRSIRPEMLRMEFYPPLRTAVSYR